MKPCPKKKKKQISQWLRGESEASCLASWGSGKPTGLVLINTGQKTSRFTDFCLFLTFNALKSALEVKRNSTLNKKKIIIYPSLSVLYSPLTTVHNFTCSLFLKIPRWNNCLYLLLDRNPTTIQKHPHKQIKTKEQSCNVRREGKKEQNEN